MSAKGSTHLRLEERKEIEKYVKLKYPTGRIASIIGRTLGCVKQELRKNGGHDKYNASIAQEQADSRQKAKIRIIRKNLTEEQHEIIRNGVTEGFSIRHISVKCGLSTSIVGRWMREQGLHYKRKNYAGVQERLTALEFQIEILKQQLEEMYERNSKD
jgi:IS30 family transposase